MKGDCGFGFGLVCWSVSLCVSSVGILTVLMTAKVPGWDPLSAAGVERSDVVGGLGDGDEGGLKSSYLQACHN